jgi:hypothetical protein
LRRSGGARFIGAKIARARAHVFVPVAATTTGATVTSERTATTGRHPAQWLALVIGAVYVLVGLVGFAVTGFDGFAEPDGELLLGIFEINPLHNIVHLLIGAAGLALWNRLDRARIALWPAGDRRAGDRSGTAAGRRTR